MGGAPTVRAEVDKRRDDDEEQVHPRDRAVGIDRPRVRERRERHEEEAQQRPDQVLVGVAEIVAEDHHQDDRQARHRQGQTTDETRHSSHSVH